MNQAVALGSEFIWNLHTLSAILDHQRMWVQAILVQSLFILHNMQLNLKDLFQVGNPW